MPLFALEVSGVEIGPIYVSIWVVTVNIVHSDALENKYVNNNKLSCGQRCKNSEISSKTANGAKLD